MNLGYLCGQLVNYPVQNILILLQSYEDINEISDGVLGTFDGGFDCLRKIIQQNGLGFLWRGCTASMVKNSITAILNQYCEDKLVEILQGKINKRYSTFKKFLISFIGGSLVGGISLALIYPLYQTRIKLITDVNLQYQGIIHCLLQTYFNNGFLGFRGLYKGYWESFYGIVLYNAIHFFFELIDISDYSEGEQALYMQSCKLLCTLLSSPFEIINRKKVMGTAKKGLNVKEEYQDFFLNSNYGNIRSVFALTSLSFLVYFSLK